MEPYKIAEDDLQAVTGGLNNDQKSVIGVGSGIGGLAVIGGAGALIARKAKTPAGGGEMTVAQINAIERDFRGNLSRVQASLSRPLPH
jgi:hypothetical protein